MTEARRTSNIKTAKQNILCVLFGLCVLFSSACGRANVFRQYEYEEDTYLSLDGSATVYVNSSIPALDALRGASFDASPAARTDREAVRAYYTSPHAHVVWVRTSRRSNRRFVHVRLEVDDVRKLPEAAPFAWSVIKFGPEGGVFHYEQTVGAPAGKEVSPAKWNGRETVAFRLHLPSKIVDQNTTDLRRGNILVWEQPLADRLHGVPLTLDARMETQSILNRTLWLFAATFLAVALVFAVVILWVLKR